MEKECVILRKDNGEVTYGTRKVLSDSKAYINSNDNCLSEILDVNSYTKVKSNDCEVLKREVYSIVNELGKFEDSDIINQTVSKIKTISQKDDIISIIDNLLANYLVLLKKRKSSHKVDEDTSNSRPILGERNYNNIKNAIKDNFDLVSSIFIKKVISYYYLNKLNNLGQSMVDKLERAKISGVSIDELFMIIGEEIPEASKETGINKLCENIFSDAVDTVYDQSQRHMCWENCANALPGKCPKISDRLFIKTLEDFPFITDGYQVFSENGEVERFVVNSCDNFKLEIPKKRISSKELNLARANILMHYFDATTPEEAMQTYADLLNRGELVNPRGRLPRGIKNLK